MARQSQGGSVYRPTTNPKPVRPNINLTPAQKAQMQKNISLAQKQSKPSGGGGYGGGYSGNSSATTTTVNNTFPGFDAYEKYISEYRTMLEENQRKLDQLAEENYKAQIASNEQNAKDQRNQANLNSARTDRWINQQYGSGISGKGLTNQLRNQTALNNQIATINQNLASNNSVANLNRYNTLQGNLDNKLTKMASVDDSYLNYLKKLAGI